MSLTGDKKENISAVFAGNCNKNNLCPVKDIIASFGDKWSLYTILLLGNENMRFSELLSCINGISQRMLTVTLRSLEENGIVFRQIFAQMPIRVDYKLTPLGESLVDKVVPLAYWANEHADKIIIARKKYVRNEE